MLGICYGRSVNTIGEQLYGTENISDKERTKKAQKVYDSVLLAFPNLRQLMTSSQNFAKQNGYVETILGRRRHLPDMQLPEFQFEPLPGYVNSRCRSIKYQYFTRSVTDTGTNSKIIA